MDYDHSIIKKNPFFASLEEPEYLLLLDNMRVVQLNPQEILFREGDFSDAFYIVAKGAIRIFTIDSTSRTIFLARIGEKAFFGEQAFSLTSSPRRRATAIAQTATTLYKFPRQTLIALNLTGERLKSILQKQDITYLNEKINKLISDIQHTSPQLENITKQKRNYVKREIIFSQGDPAQYAYILVNGEVELRSYDQDQQLTAKVTIASGQIFGNEGLAESGTYAYTAVVIYDATVLSIEASQYKTIIQNNPLLKELCVNFNRQIPFQAKGKIFQFRSEYLNMPALTSIITLNNGREIVCQQIASLSIFLASLTNTVPDQEIKYYHSDTQNRTLFLQQHHLIQLKEYGIWEDSYYLLNLLIQDTLLTDDQIKTFEREGRIQFHEDTGSEEIICKCMRVKSGVINQLIAQKANINDIIQRTGAGTICGGCRPKILEMMGTDAWTPCVITRILTHHQAIKSFQIKPIDRNITPFKPGQYLVIKAMIGKVWVQRNYTLTSMPDDGYYEITVKKEPHGLFSPWLFEHNCESAIVYVSGPYGEFTLESAQEKPVICFMGGIGITPAISFIRHITKRKQQQLIYVDYSALNAELFILKDELLQIEKKFENVIINHRNTSMSGFLIPQDIAQIIFSKKDAHVYVCGPKGLEKLVVESLRKMNFPKQRLHVEEFIHAGSPDISPTTINYE